MTTKTIAKTRYSTSALELFCSKLFVQAGMEADKADAVARLLVITDAMGRRTHGLAQASAYLSEIEAGRMALSGSYTVLRDNGHVAVWDGNYLPGQWLMEQALALAGERARRTGLSAVAIRRNHHIGCLAALVKIAADQGLVALIANSDPASSRAAPFGGTEAVFTPNPWALGYPAGASPVLIDTSATITSTSMTRTKFAAGEHFEKPWLLDAQGRPTTDPAVLENTSPRGSLLLTGGLDHGHKGYAITLMVEALSQGLSGQGRKNPPTRWGGNTYLQVIDPECFAGRAVFEDEMAYLAERCRATRPIDPNQPVRVPGDASMRGIAAARTQGIAFAPATWSKLEDWARKLGVALPEPLPN